MDWLRVLALGLLIVFHIVLCFQPWARAIGFPQNEQLLEELGPLVALLAVWRIPILFLISGMGVRFAMERRDWKQLLMDRSLRILLPYVACTFVLGFLLHFALPHLGWKAEYEPNFGHLWFLLNIYLYVLWLLSLLVYLKGSPDNALFRGLSRVIRWPLGLFLFALPIALEAWLVDPEYFTVYAGNLHGMLIGLVCFFLGFAFISVQDVFWPAVERLRWITLAVALSLFAVRLAVFQLQEEPPPLVALESTSWMLAILGFASRHLDRPPRALTYLGAAVYPVYILHMPVQFAVASLVLPLRLPAYSKLALLLVGTFGVCFLLYEIVLRRSRWIRPLFGMKGN